MARQPQAPASPAAMVSLGRRRVAEASAWVVVGYGVRQVLRLGSNLILTRLLFPEAFGLMSLVMVFLEAIQMFSDLGIRTSVIRSAEGHRREYLDTAWTLQAIRGIGLWLIALVGAVPFARFYEEPLLLWLIPIAGLKAVLLGLRSAKTLTQERNVLLGRLLGIEIGAYFLSLVLMIVGALLFESVWVLVAGALFGVALEVLAGYLLLPGDNARFGLHAEVVSDIVRFGKWLFLSTALTFLLQQGEKLLLAKLMPIDAFGVYAIAAIWARTPLQVGLTLGSRVLFPSLSRIRDRSLSHLRSRVLQVRMAYLGLLLPPLLALSVVGDHVIWFLLDDRYAAAGWVVRVMASGAVAAVIGASAGNALLVQGDSFRHMLLQITRGSLLIGGMLVGWRLGAQQGDGIAGVIIGASVAKWLDYPVLAWGLHRNGVWLPWLDIAMLFASLVVIVLGWWLLPLAPALAASTLP